ncbi:hypothetical protein NHX12_004792 [Muraenolepis orangiensis]|uniref:EML-like second beta-propeller domain-containing protein n=1 Tax=Muraenolepis orangiensis TaxID=630683 RepID=A0A9Q0DTE5_9TELE|nr:hypothetical protein NHX12_004792 [Muraenolepis orangiensis]
MQALALSPNRRYLAVAESGGERPTVTVYDLTHEQGRKRKVLTAGDLPVGEFLCMAFSPDSKYLIGQSGGPKWTLVLWLWEKQKVMATVSSSDGDPVSFSPQDNAQVCVSGLGLLRLFQYGEGTLRRVHAAKVGAALLCHAWLSGTQVVAGTDTGRLLMFESGDLRRELDTGVGPVPETRHADSKRPDGTEAERRVGAVVPYAKGFVCSVGPGTVCVYQITEENDGYRKTREILIPLDPCCNEPSQAQQQEVATMCLSPSEETLALSTQQGQLYSINLVSAEISRGEQAYFEFLSSSFHSRPITGLSICIRNKLVATCSLDRSVRVWNYDTNVLEVYKEFQEEALSVALHPSGHFLLVGFTDKLRMMNLLIDDIRTVKEFTCVFSHGGHLFAAINGNVIHIYSVTTFDNVLTLKGHNGKVQAVVWSTDDGRLVSCGTDGAVYEWNTLSGKRESESVLKSCVYTGVAISPDARTIFAAGTGLKEIQDCQVLREVPADGVTYTALAVSRSGKVIFTGTSSGTIRVFKYPLSQQKDWIEYQAHCGPVTKVLVTFDDQLLLTASGDGSLLVWKIVDKEGRGLRDKEVYYTEEVLITKTDLEEKNQNMHDLKSRVEELKMEKEYQLRLSDISYDVKIKELSETFIREIESLKTQNQVMKREGVQQVIAHQEVLVEIREKNSKELQTSESSNSQKLLLEYTKLLGAAEQSGALALEELSLSYQAKLHDKTQQLEQCQAETKQQRREYRENKRQIEEDRDQEISSLDLSYEKRLFEEKELNVTMKGQAGMLRKQGAIHSLEKETQGLKRTISEGVETIRVKMEAELECFHQKNTKLELCGADLKMKLAATDKERNRETQRVKQCKATVDRFQVDLNRCTTLLQDPKQLKKAMQEMCDKYSSAVVTERGQVEIAGLEPDIHREYAHQRDHLEKMVCSLKTQLARDSEVQGQNSTKLLKENMSLIQEINELRQELRTLRSQLHDHQIQTDIATRTKHHRRSPDATGSRSAEGSSRVTRLNGEEEEVDRMVQLQRAQIQQLKPEVQGQGSAFRPPSTATSSSTRLPALHT